MKRQLATAINGEDSRILERPLILRLLGVTFDVEKEFDTWHLLDYAARDDDFQS